MECKNQAFTLLELLVTVAILGILAVIGAVSYQKALVESKIVRVQTSHHQISNEYISFYLVTGKFPASRLFTPPRGSGINTFYPTGHPKKEFWHSFINQVGESTFYDPFLDHDYLVFVLGSTMNSQYSIPKNPKPYSYVMSSAGPDCYLNQPSNIIATPVVIYSNTNGIFSEGDIFHVLPLVN